MNLCIKPNILSLKNFYDINNGSLTKLLTDVLALFIKHISSCEKCTRMGRTCGICNSEEKMYVFDLKNTTLCDRCNEMYHRNCLLVSDCERCKHEGWKDRVARGFLLSQKEFSLFILVWKFKSMILWVCIMELNFRKLKGESNINLKLIFKRIVAKYKENKEERDIYIQDS